MSAAPAPHWHRAARTPLVRQLRRAVGQDHNPLCRPVDRARSRLLIAASLALTLSVVLSVLLALILLSGMRAQAHRTALHRHQVTATTLAASSDSPGLTAASARASWEYPQADHRTGVIPVAVGTAAGTGIPLWVDDNGSRAAPPEPDSQLATTVGMYGLGAFTGAGAVLWTGYVLRRRTLERRAERAWEPDWEQVEPFWSRRVDGPGSDER